MKIEKLSQEDVYQYLDHPHDPPVFDVQYDRHAFSEEWHAVRTQLKSLLDKHGEFDAYGTKDYNIGETTALSRGIGVEVNSEKLLNKKLIADVKNFLLAIDKKYEIDFSFFTIEGLFHLFVSRDSIKTNCPASLLDRLGL